MQTFLPYDSYYLSAKCLDNKRLGKQRVEAKQILDILLGRAKLNKFGKISWVNHPAVKMWKGFEPSLCDYMNTMIQEWIDRGFNNSMEFEFLNNKRIILPEWLGYSPLHSSHRSNLLKKNYEYYSQFNWKDQIGLPYYWPI